MLIDESLPEIDAAVSEWNRRYDVKKCHASKIHIVWGLHHVWGDSTHDPDFDYGGALLQYHGCDFNLTYQRPRHRDFEQINILVIRDLHLPMRNENDWRNAAAVGGQCNVMVIPSFNGNRLMFLRFGPISIVAVNWWMIGMAALEGLRSADDWLLQQWKENGA